MPKRRRPLGPGGSAQPPAGNQGPVPQPGGASPFRNRYEQALFGSPPPQAARPEPPPIRPSDDRRTTQEEIQEAISRASERLGPDKAAALRRAFAYGDDSALLTVRPTNTSYPPRPRTLAAGYDARSRTVFVRFRGQHLGGQSYADGVGYEYYNVSRAEWRAFRDADSPGRYINAVLNGKPYTPATW